MEIKARQEEAEKSEKEIPARLILDLRRRSLHSDENHSPQCHPENPQKSNTPSNRPNPLFAQQFGQLAQRLELAIEAFLGGSKKYLLQTSIAQLSISATGLFFRFRRLWLLRSQEI
jgi:hypothetical protein